MNPQNGNYDFILNPTPAPRRAIGLGGGGPNPKQLLIIGGGIVGVIILLFVVFSLFKSSGGSQADLTGIAQTQAELVRVATEGGLQVTQDANQQMAVNVQLTIGSQQKALTTFLAKYHVTLAPKTLALKKNPATDTQLTTAQQDSTYDVVFAQIMQNELTGYLSELQTVYKSTTSTKTKALLSTDFTQAATLLKEVPTAASLGGGQ